jgi:hypothetical protein
MKQAVGLKTNLQSTCKRSKHLGKVGKTKVVGADIVRIELGELSCHCKKSPLQLSHAVFLDYQ